MNYPTRCEIIDDKRNESRLHIGKRGIADLIDGNFSGVKITLDDGTILLACNCSWKPIK